VKFYDMQRAVCDSCKVPMANRQHWAFDLINEAVLEVCSTLRLSEPYATLVTTPNVGDYTFSTGLGVSDMVQLRDVFYQPVGQNQALPPLRRTSPSRIDEIRSRSVSNAYPWWYAVSGVGTLLLAPVPTDAGTLGFRYVQRGVVLAADSDVPSTIPPEFHDVVWLLAATKLAITKNQQAYPGLQKMYDLRLNALRSWLVDLQGEVPLTMQRAGLSIPNRDPAIYPAYS
jgi:hypothetical protein